MMKAIGTLILVFLSTSLIARENKDLIKANYYYAHLAFHEAIPFFEKIAADTSGPVVFSELADCYRFTNDLPKAATWYGKAVEQKNCAPSTMLHYGQVLMQLTRYEDAIKWLKEYAKTNPKDKRAENLIAGSTNAIAQQNNTPTGTIELLGLNTDGSEFAPTLWQNRLVFAADTAIGIKKKKDKWSGNSYFNIYSVAPDSTGKFGNNVKPLTRGKNTSSRYHDGPCTFSVDGKQMFFTRNRSENFLFGKHAIANKDSTVLLEIMIATDYDTAEKTFSIVDPFPFNSKSYSVFHPAVSPNGEIFVFASNMPKGAGGADIYYCLRKRNKEWAKPINAGKLINTEGEELFPYWADNSTLCFSSDGQAGLGGLDIFTTKWDDKLHAFSAPQHMSAPVNSSYDDMSLTLPANGGNGYFSSNRPAIKGGDNIYYYKK
ncbi:MAG: ompA [Flavipsychrobacter sp.]|nr:ompA [Flavipsychrobacter sp.]